MTTTDSGKGGEGETSSGSGSAIGDQTTVPTSTGLDPRLLELLVCPVTRGLLVFDRKRGELISLQAGLAYPIREGIPIMLADEARSLDNDERRSLGKSRPTAGG